MNTQILVALLIWFVGAITVSHPTAKHSNLAPQLKVAQDITPSIDHRGSGRIYTDCTAIVL